MIEHRIASGMEIAMMSVERQLPRNSRIISAGQRGGDHALADHAGDRRLDEDRLVAEQRTLSEGGRVCSSFGSML